MKQQTTLRDVAARADVHTSTASRALNERTRDLVSPVTVKKVLAAAEALGYQPNSLARGLKTNQTMAIGMVLPDLTNPLFPPIVRGMEDRFRGSGHTLFLANTDRDWEKERAVIEAMRSRHVDGLAIATARRDYPILQELQDADIPLVLVNRTADWPAVSAVVPDDHAGIGQAVRHLTSLGHTRIAHVAGDASTSTGAERARAYRYWLEAEGIEYDDELVATARWFTEADGAEACEQLLERGVDFTAIVAVNDLTALGCYGILREAGRSVPDDVSVVGFNDITFTHAFCPPLTSVKVPLYEVGQKAAGLLLERMSAESPVPTSVRLTPRLVRRESTANAPE